MGLFQTTFQKKGLVSRPFLVGWFPMAQGKLKVKTKVPNNAAKKGKGKANNTSSGGGVKKAKSKREQQLSKFKKEIRKGINKSIEEQVVQKTKQVEDRGFHCGDLGGTDKKKQQPKKK